MPGLETVIEPRPEGRLRITSTIADDDRPCPALFHLVSGAASSLTRILDLPSAVVSSEVSERSARLDVLLPPSGTLMARTRRMLRAYFSARGALERMEAQQREMQRHLDTLHRSYSQLQVSAARQLALTNSLLDTMAELSPDGRFVFVSPSIEALTGYRAHQVVGSHLSLWLHRDDVERGKQLLQEIEHRGRTPEPSPVLRVRHDDRRTVWAEITARTFRTSDDELHMAVILRDVSHRFAV
jgi:PAS domain S-box-containing protein